MRGKAQKHVKQPEIATNISKTLSLSYLITSEVELSFCITVDLFLTSAIHTVAKNYVMLMTFAKTLRFK
jgi:hypothetical protein